MKFLQPHVTCVVLFNAMLNILKIIVSDVTVWCIAYLCKHLRMKAVGLAYKNDSSFVVSIITVCCLFPINGMNYFRNYTQKCFARVINHFRKVSWHPIQVPIIICFKWCGFHIYQLIISFVNYINVPKCQNVTVIYLRKRWCSILCIRDLALMMAFLLLFFRRIGVLTSCIGSHLSFYSSFYKLFFLLLYTLL